MHYKAFKKLRNYLLILIIFTAPISCTGNITGTGDDVPGGSDGEVSSPISSFPTPPGLITNELIVYGETFNNEIPIYGKVNSDAAGFYLAASTTEFQSEIVSNLTKFDVILSEAKDLFRPISLAHATTINTEIPIPNVSNHTCDDAGVSYTKILDNGSLEGALYVPGGSDMVYLAITDCVSQWSEVVKDEVNSALNFYNSTPKTMTVVDDNENTQLLVIDEDGKLKESLITEDAFTALGDRNDNFSQRDDLNGNNKLNFDDDSKKVVALSDNVGATSWDVDQQNVDDPFELVDDVLSQVVDTEKYTHLKKTFDGSTWYGTRPDPNADLNSVSNIYRATEVNPAGTQFCNANNAMPEANCIGFRETKVFDRIDYEPHTVIIAAANIDDSEVKLYLKYFNSLRENENLDLGGNNTFNINSYDFIDLTIIKDQTENKTGKVLVTDKIQKGLWMLEYFINFEYFYETDRHIFTDELNPNKFISLDKTPLAIDFDKSKNSIFILLEGDEIQIFKLKDGTGNVLDIDSIKNSKSVISLKNIVNKNITLNANSLSIHQTENTAKLFIGSSGILGAMTVSVNLDEVDEKPNLPLDKKPNLSEQGSGSIGNQGEEDENDGTDQGDRYF